MTEEITAIIKRRIQIIKTNNRHRRREEEGVTFAYKDQLYKQKEKHSAELLEQGL